MPSTLEMVGSPGLQGTLETITWDFNTSSALAGGDTVSSPSVTGYIYTASTNSWSAVTSIFSGSPTVSGSTISHTITSMSMGRYLVRIAFNAGGSKKLESFAFIDCPL